ncbi:MAG TPA: hypothetical protein VN040_01975, partial [Pseudosphingobacterium sp.]|nr:hypothetical protein [Pseudosphingobacterium sp.]
MGRKINSLKLVVCLALLTLSAGRLFGQSAQNAEVLYQPKNDTLFSKPYIDTDEWRDKPVRHRYIHGGFKGTSTKFSFYFPAKDQYKGHFFQYVTPFPDSETLSQGATGEEDKIGFSVSGGAYFIETNGGGAFDFSKPTLGQDASIGAYKANAAAANYSKTVAAKMYGPHRVYGYLFGGSGGAYRTIGGIESTEGVWDGAVPYVVGSPMAIPNVFTVRMNAMRILKDKFPQIIDAMEPGGSGDIYAGLNDEEKAALFEVTKMGFPTKSWFGYQTMGVHGFIAVYQGMVGADPNYFNYDFWNTTGYLGANPPASLLKARIQKVSKIKLGIPAQDAVTMGLILPEQANERGTADLAWKSMGKPAGTMPVAFQLEDQMPDVDFLGGDLIVKSGAATGKRLQLSKVAGDKIVLGPADASILALVQPGDEVQVDNSNFLAAQTYHRHQVPPLDQYPEWKQFCDASGKPLYPQRPFLLGPLFTKGAAGILPSGKFKGKMIVLSSLWDREAWPWQADWYRSRVKDKLGDSADSHLRLWYTDRALHGDLTKQEDPTRTVSYVGVLQQALRDLSAWVEKGVPPPATTNYKIEDGQVIVPATAIERKGIQPVVTVKVNGAIHVEVKTGQSINFTGVIELPAHTGKVISAKWDFDGAGTYPLESQIKAEGDHVSVNAAYTFTKTGTYFPVLLVASQRDGDTKTPFTRIYNL